GMAATTPAGALVDRTRAKRGVVIAAILMTVVATLALLVSIDFVWATATQVVAHIAAAIFPPAIAGITLGIVRQKGYARQLGRNEAFNHAGNVAAALLAGAAGWLFGLSAVFVVLAAMAAASIVATASIDPADIDHRAARGLPENKESA